MSDRANVVYFIRQSAALREPRWRGLPVFRPRADRGDALVDTLRTGIGHALYTLTIQSQECETCGGDGKVESYTGRVLADGGGECAEGSCEDCLGGEVEVLACVHGQAHEQGEPLHDRCWESWLLLAQPVGDAAHGSEIATDVLAGCSA